MIRLFKKPLEECLLRIAKQESLSPKQVQILIYNRDEDCNPLFCYATSNGKKGNLTFKQVLNIKTIDPFARETIAFPKLKNAFKSEAEIKEIKPQQIVFGIYTESDKSEGLKISIIHNNSINRVCTLEEIMGLD